MLFCVLVGYGTVMQLKWNLKFYEWLLLVALYFYLSRTSLSARGSVVIHQLCSVVGGYPLRILLSLQAAMVLSTASHMIL